MSYTLKNIAEIIGSNAVVQDEPISHLLTDSRKLIHPAESVFFALHGPHRDGHDFISALYEKGVRYFVVSKIVDDSNLPGAVFLRVDDTLSALQKMAAEHRLHFNYPVIGITGSNGKTIVKEWLWQILSKDYHIIRNPKSYNSQIGVPLSVWQMNSQHDLGIFEAGISEPGEMDKLQQIIKPTIGVITNIGEAHSSGFRDHFQKAEEKLKLFKDSAVIIYSADQPVVHQSIQKMGDANNRELFSWGRESSHTLMITATSKRSSSTHIGALYRQQSIEVEIPFTDDASIENAITCWCVFLYLNVDPSVIFDRMKNLQPVNMRLELIPGINNCTIINDSYSADLSSLNIALDFLEQQTGRQKKTVILSDLVQSGLTDSDLYAQVAHSLKQRHVDRVIGIGNNIATHLDLSVSGNDPTLNRQFFDSVKTFTEQFRQSNFRVETILVKGARIFEFEKIVHLLEKKLHQTVLEIDLKALAYNVNQFRMKLKPGTKIMAMVKAFAYGSGGIEIASVLQYHKVDYLCVAYADEGITLRQGGIQLPIMVLNADENSFDAIISQNLEPVIFSVSILETFIQFLNMQGLQDWPIHLEIETGMNRLGFSLDDISLLQPYLEQKDVSVKSIFSHLTSSEDANDDEYTANQYALFNEAEKMIRSFVDYPFLKHLSNTAAVIRHPGLQFDMVRLGIGMYGVNPTDQPGMQLETVATLRSTIAQIKKVKAGETVGYNRKEKLKEDSLIATVRIGYADGYLRALGNGAGKMLVNGKLAPVVGTVCMDMTMINISNIPGVKEGDEVIVFGKDLPVKNLAEWADTISYEIMTGISERVKRVYFEE